MSEEHLTTRGRWLRPMLSILLLAGLITVTTSTSASAQTCNDGRGWSEDRLVDGICTHINVCSPEEIALQRTSNPDELTWQWTFPRRCPMESIDAMGVLVERTADGVVRIEDQGQPSPARVGSGRVAMPCGHVELYFTVTSGSDLVATGRGSALGTPCPPPVDPSGPTANEVDLGVFSHTTGTTAELARLYWAVFGRRPDVGGFGYWSARANGGTSMAEITRLWTGLVEWTSVYDGLGNEQFLTAIYQNVLGRAPDRGGFDYWLERLDTGLSRDRLVRLFSDAPEFRQRTRTS